MYGFFGRNNSRSAGHFRNEMKGKYNTLSKEGENAASFTAATDARRTTNVSDVIEFDI